jgi:hypothetical protein
MMLIQQYQEIVTDDFVPPQKSEEEEDNASNNLGSVVDKLLISRVSVAPSLGGSIVNAMANVSEVEKSDDVEEEEEEESEKGVNYWEGEDIDLDSSLGRSSELTGRHSHHQQQRHH